MLLLATDFRRDEIAQYLVNEVPIIAQQYPNVVDNKFPYNPAKLLAATGFTVQQLVARQDAIKEMHQACLDQDVIRAEVDMAVASKLQRVRQKLW